MILDDDFFVATCDHLAFEERALLSIKSIKSFAIDTVNRFNGSIELTR